MQWLLPQGIEDLLPPQAGALEQLRRQLLDLFARWGYQLVIPPLVEYADALLTGVGGDLHSQTFKVNDPLTGGALAIRADMTPQAARIDARYGRADAPSRLCYLGGTLNVTPATLDASRNPLQVGAELFGHAGPESDIEIVRLMLDMLALVGISDVHVDLGHVGIFRALAGHAGLDDDTERQLFDLLQSKARPDIREFLAGLDLAPGQRERFALLADLHGDISVLAQARERLAGAETSVVRALDELEAIALGLRSFCPDQPLFFDLSELRGYDYHTGLVFAAYAPIQGQAVAWGGRYDGIGRVFGSERPATGFSADLKKLAAGYAGQAPAANPVLAPWDADPGLQARVRELRGQGREVSYQLPGSPLPAQSCARLTRDDAGHWQLQEAQDD